MIDAFKDMVDKKQINNWKFVIASSIQDKDMEAFSSLKNSATGYPIEFLINQTNHALWEIYNKAKIYWHASGFGEDLDKHPEFLDKEQVNIDYWKKVQKQIIQKYGTDDHEATKKMLAEIGANEEIAEIVLNKSFDKSLGVKSSSNWALKILYYADFRTLPAGIGTLEERIADVKARMPKYTSRSDFEDLVAAGREIEKQLQQNLNVPVSEINDGSVKIDTESFLDLEI